MYFCIVFGSRTGTMRPFGVQSYKNYLNTQSFLPPYFCKWGQKYHILVFFNTIKRF